MKKLIVGSICISIITACIYYAYVLDNREFMIVNTVCATIWGTLFINVIFNKWQI